MATALRSRTWSIEAVQSPTASRRRSCVACQANKQTPRESGTASTVRFNVAAGVAVSLAATTLLCSTDLALAARVQGGDFDNLDIFSSGKTGVRLEESRLKSKFGPSPPPKKEAPKVVEPVPSPAVPKKSVKKQAPVKKPVVKAQPPKPVKKAEPAKKPSKPALDALLKKKPTKPEPAQKPISPPKPKPAPASTPSKGFSAPSISLPTVSASSRDATEAAAVLGIEILLALIASSAVSGLLKKA